MKMPKGLPEGPSFRTSSREKLLKSPTCTWQQAICFAYISHLGLGRPRTSQQWCRWSRHDCKLRTGPVMSGVEVVRYLHDALEPGDVQVVIFTNLPWLAHPQRPVHSRSS
jgi:hypothetical protein